MPASSPPRSGPSPTTSPSTPEPNPEFSHPAAAARIETTARALESRGIRAIVVKDRQEARRVALELIPRGAEVLDATSQTLIETGIGEALHEPGRIHDLRPELARLSKEGRGSDQRRLGSAPEWVVGSVHAVTEQGQVVIASATGSQLAPYVFGAEHVIWVVGAQKIVPSLDEAFRRIREYAYPREDRRALVAYGMGSVVAKLLVMEREVRPGRITMILVPEALGF